MNGLELILYNIWTEMFFSLLLIYIFMRCILWILLKLIKRSRTADIVIGCLCIVVSIVIGNLHAGEELSKFLYESIEWGIFWAGLHFFINLEKKSEN